MTSTIEARLQFLAQDAHAVAQEVARECDNLRAAVAASLRRLRESRQLLDKLDGTLIQSKVSDAALAAVEAEFEVPKSAILGRGRTANVTLARQVAVWLLLRSDWTTADAGAVVRRDHSTAMHARRSVEARRETEPKFKDRTDKLCASLGIQ